MSRTPERRADARSTGTRPRWTRRDLRLLGLLLLIGATIRVAMAFATHGESFDITSYASVGGLVARDPLSVYEHMGRRWPYPPGLWPWLLVARSAAFRFGLPFHGVIQLAPIAGDLGVAAVVAHVLRSRLRSRAWLAGAAAVALGPSFLLISGYHGQFDALAFLPALVGVAVWQRGGAHRGVVAGLLIGLGGVLKTAPLITLLFLWPSARSRREILKLAGSAVGLFLLSVIPFLLRDAWFIRAALSYAGMPGLGGWSVLVQPDLVDLWILGGPGTIAPSTTAIVRWGSLYVAVALGGLAGWLRVHRAPPDRVAVVSMLALYAVAPNIFVQYYVWGLGFLLLAGRIRLTVWVQVALLVPTVIVLLRPWGSGWIASLHLVWTVGLWIGAVVLTLIEARSLHRELRVDGRLRPYPGTTASGALAG